MPIPEPRRRAVVIGYYTYITGGGKIVPPIDDAKLKHFDINNGTGTEDSYFIFTQVPGDQTVQLINGVPTVVGTDPGCTEVDFGYQESGKFYGFSASLGHLIDLCIAEGAVFNATFDGDGEESDDFWQYVVTNNVFEHVQGQITFDDAETSRAMMRSKMVEAIKALDPSEIHGNIIPRKDGTRTMGALYCPGLPSCTVCQQERTLLNSLIWGTG